MKHLYLAIEACFAAKRAPRLLHEFDEWLALEGKSEGSLVGDPIFVNTDSVVDENEEL